MTMTLIETVTLTSSASSIEFTSIPQDGVDLLLVASSRTDPGVNHLLANIQPNGQTSNRSYLLLRGTGSTVSSFGGSSILGPATNKAFQTSSTFANSQVYISNYSGSAAKSFSFDGVDENNATAANQFLVASSWNSTAPITSLVITTSTDDDFVANSTASLYKIS